MSDLLRGATPQLLADYFFGGESFVNPEKILDNLTAEVACQRPLGAPYSAAEVVAHIDFWQNHILDALSGVGARPVEHAIESWPSVEKDQWELLKTSTLSNLEQLKRYALEESDRVLKSNETVGARLESFMVHNAYHWGQVVLLRRMMEPEWPRPGEGLTW
ncbi:DinB family protein [Deinococcus cellulosilyticus]|uniref:DinB-like domain-containing protein n=1 Tax=Deinococcus cellulosilyticus (strain DSM 18568 / NBRC 106333 / KACC 11606 / 5516J-15) TaxID=1223518 RepID=A0A511N6N4_DEIC1|nr:DinB family protein [Deinococcus cellulosilyticus]GEM48128.1 hypothetical protein DC3_37630 [Deinococcus cellulosilyticus NBRC 106333 = KACC 11606]